ncbi:MAG TPA: T9SS type A sorting domain-containing protein [Ohtaekwangia sp.]
MEKKKTNKTRLTFLTSYPLARYACISIFFFITSIDLLAQLTVYPTQRKSAAARKSPPAARTQSTDPLSLPFFDDFSFTPVDDLNDTLSNYPLDSIWMNSQSVWISSGIGINAPSKNVATFDGLDSLGLPYTDVTLASGLCDSLVSHPIKLGKPHVSQAERNSIWFSFRFQWQGNGEPPDDNDYLRLMFRNRKGRWIQMWRSPNKNYDPTVFYDTIIQVNDVPSAPANDTARFFHDNFQFKFENRGRKTGQFDTWNVDYIYLNKGRTINSKSFPDRALASGITPLFAGYYAVPINHFFASPEIDSVEVDIQSNSDTDLNAIEYESTIIIRDSVDNTVNKNQITLVTGEGVGESGGILSPYERVRQRVAGLPELTDFNSDAFYIDAVLSVNVTGDSLNAGPFNPINFRVNDTASVRYVLHDYYAYDDGSAEYSAVNAQAGDHFAYAFDMLDPEPDTLTGFYAYFPSFALNGSRQINIHIYKDNNGVPQNQPYYSIPGFTVQRIGINQFQFIKIIEPVVLQGRFYIGYESVSVRIGLDMSHDTGDRIFDNIGKVWYPNTKIHGSIMLRPVFGKSTGEGPITGIPEGKLLSLYPNPSKGQFFMKGDATLLEAYSVTGRSVNFTSEEFGDGQQITFINPVAGLYILKIKKENQIITHKVIVY